MSVYSVKKGVSWCARAGIVGGVQQSHERRARETVAKRSRVGKPDLYRELQPRVVKPQTIASRHRSCFAPEFGPERRYVEFEAWRQGSAKSSGAKRVVRGGVVQGERCGVNR